MPVKTDIIGGGLAWPVRLNGRGGFKTIFAKDSPESGIDKVRSSIIQILSTKVGTRVIDRDFGCDLRDTIFEPLDAGAEISQQRIATSLSEALQRWEKRAEITKLQVSFLRASEGVLEIHLEFRLLATHQVGNLVYDLYIDPSMRTKAIVVS